MTRPPQGFPAAGDEALGLAGAVIEGAVVDESEGDGEAEADAADDGDSRAVTHDAMTVAASSRGTIAESLRKRCWRNISLSLA